MKPIFIRIIPVIILFTTALTSFGQGNTDNIYALKFTTIDQYIQVIESKSVENLRTINGFQNYVSIAQTQRTENPPPELRQDLPDDGYDVREDVSTYDKNDYFAHTFLSNILNTDKVVIIGNWIIKVDLFNERALVLNTSYAGQYSDILNDNLSNTNILVFSLDDDGVEILKGLNNGIPVSELRLWCSDRSAAAKKDDRFAYRDNRHRLDMKVVYQKAFIIFSLEGKAKTQKRFLRIWWHDGEGLASMRYIQLSYEVRCSDKGFQYFGDPCQYGCLPGYTAGSTCHYQPYLSTRALKNYMYKIDFSSTHGNGHVEIEDH